jgi:membrane-associated phospholipid phosphatase
MPVRRAPPAVPPGLIRRRQLLGVAVLATLATVPLLGPLDAWLDGMLDAWRSCAGEEIATLVSRLVTPVGVTLLTVAVLRALRLGRPRPVEIAGILAALIAGVLLVGELKELLDRPRPGAEFLGPSGASFPSGHVGNTVLNGLAVLALWSDGAPKRRQRIGWVVLAAAVLVVAAARVYGRRHWPSDTLGTAALALSYGLFALHHPDARWRRGVTVAAVAAIGLVYAASEAGLRIEIPAGTVAGRRLPVHHVVFGAAYERGLLRGSWSPDVADTQRRSVWLRASAGELTIDAVDPSVSELRIVLRPRYDTDGAASCRRLRVALNGRLLGERALQVGWKSYTFFTTDADIRSDGNVLRLEVRREPSEAEAATERRAAFVEVTLHSATAPAATALPQPHRRDSQVAPMRASPAARPLPRPPVPPAASAASCRHC